MKDQKYYNYTLLSYLSNIQPKRNFLKWRLTLSAAGSWGMKVDSIFPPSPNLDPGENWLVGYPVGNYPKLSIKLFWNFIIQLTIRSHIHNFEIILSDNSGPHKFLY